MRGARVIQLPPAGSAHAPTRGPAHVRARI